MKEYSTKTCGNKLQLVAYDDKLAFYADPDECDSITTVRRDRKKLTKKDRREADKQIDFLLHNEAWGNS